MKSVSVFENAQYQAYLIHRAGKPGTRRGHRSAMAKAMKCHSSYLTKVLNLEAHMSLEQAYRLNSYFNHSEEEAHFFILLVQKGRAGSKELAGYFEKQIQEILQRRQLVSERIQIKKTLNLEDQATYYSAWYYAAIHVALTIPELQTKTALSTYFGLAISKVSEVLAFLVNTGLAFQDSGSFKVGKVEIHLGKQSPNISRHHTNWRTQAISSLDREGKQDLHYSSAVSLSSADALRLKNDLLEVISNTARTIGTSKEEEMFCFALDFFSLRAGL